MGGEIWRQEGEAGRGEAEDTIESDRDTIELAEGRGVAWKLAERRADVKTRKDAGVCLVCRLG